MKKADKEDVDYWKKPGGYEHKTKEKCSLKKPWIPVVLYHCLTQQDKQLVKTVEIFHIVDNEHLSKKKLFQKTTQFSILKLKTMYCNNEIIQSHFHINAIALSLSILTDS